MDEEIISKIYTQFVERWQFKPNVLFLNNIFNYDKLLERSGINIYIIINFMNELVLQTILLNADNPWVNAVYLIYKNEHYMFRDVNNPKVHRLLVNTCFEINISDIFNSFEENAVNVLLNDYVVLDYNNILNLYYITPTDVGILSPHKFNDIIPKTAHSFKAFSYQPDTLISDISGIVIRGKPKEELNYYLFEGFQNLIVEKMNSINYNISNVSLMTECYLIQKQTYSSGTYITNHFNINFPIIFATFTKFDDINKESDLIVSYEKLYNELYIPKDAIVEYGLLYSTKDIKLLDINSQIDLSKLKSFLQYKLYEEHNAKREMFLKNSMRDVERDQQILLSKLQLACISEKESIIKDNNILRKKLEEDLKNDILARTNEIEEEYESLYAEKQKELKLYEESIKERIEYECNLEMIKKNEELSKLIADKKYNDFNALHITMEGYRIERMVEIDTYIKDIYIAEKTKEVTFQLEEYKKQKEIEINNFNDKLKIEANRLLDEYAQNQRESIQKNVRQEFLEKYVIVYNNEVDILNKKLCETRKNEMAAIYYDISIIKTDMITEIKTKRANEINNLKKYIETYKAQKLKEINEELEHNKEYGLRISKINIDIEMNEYADGKRKDADNEVEEYKTQLKNEAYQSGKIHRESIIEDNETHLSEYKERRLLAIDAEVAEYSKEIIKEKTEIASAQLVKKMKEIEDQYKLDIKEKFANKYNELDIKLRHRKKKMEDDIDYEIIGKRKSAHSELASEIEKDRSNAYEKLKSELSIYTKTSHENIKTQHETLSLELLQQREGEHNKLKEEMLEKLKNDIYLQETKIQEEMRELIANKYTEELKVSEENHVRQTETIKQMHNAKIEDIRKTNNEIIRELENQLLQNKNICLEQYAKEKQLELRKMEENAIIAHNKTIDDLKQTLSLLREMELKITKEECLTMKERVIRDIKAEYDRENKKYWEDERVKAMEAVTAFTDDFKKLKLNDTQAYIDSMRELKLQKLDEEMEKLKETKTTELHDDLEKYRQEEQRKIISRFSNLKNT